jgi:hypothetical protein
MVNRGDTHSRSGERLRLRLDPAIIDTAHFARAIARNLNKLLRQDRTSYELGLGDLKVHVERAFQVGLNPQELARLLNRDLQYGLTAAFVKTTYCRIFSIHRVVRKKTITILEMPELLPKGRQTVINMGTTFMGVFNLEQLKDLIVEIRSASQPDLAVIVSELVRLNNEHISLEKLGSPDVIPEGLAPNSAKSDSKSELVLTSKMANSLVPNAK